MTIGQYDGGAGRRPLWARKLVVAVLRLTRVCIGSLATVVVLAVVEAYWVGVHFRRATAEETPRAAGSYGAGYAGATIRLAVLGDSNALGVGASRRSQTIPALLARGLSAKAARPVILDNVAVSGAESRDLAAQIGLLTGIPDVTVILVGGNDVMQLRSIPASAALLASAIRHLQSQGGQVVVGTCPDMGTIQALVPPLRFIAGWYSRVLAVAQTFVVLRAGGRAVAIGGMLGPQFLENPGQMFATDHFHSSPLGYARAARLLLPSVCAAAAPVTGVHLAVPRTVFMHRRAGSGWRRWARGWDDGP
ncbi:SGNH/GDSL hydrolase family protein [Arthrobacter sp. A5]|uniref:SGNH/GDSL hydrolase family protein n=1 Tax=Arthrobacter sp. A5 TaxID=576926 RepID=UPI003DA890A6